MKIENLNNMGSCKSLETGGVKFENVERKQAVSGH